MEAEESKKETLKDFIESQPYYGTCTTEYKEGIEVGANWQAERMYIEIEQKWLEYRSNTNNEDAWCFKEWLVEQFKSE